MTVIKTLILTALVIVTAVFGILLLTQTTESQTKLKEDRKEAIQPKDPTQTWQTYSANLAGIQLTFKYPANWFVTAESTAAIRVQNYDPATADAGAFAFTISLADLVKDARTIAQLQALLPPPGSACYFQETPAGTLVVSEESTAQVGQYRVYSRTTHCSQKKESSLLSRLYITTAGGSVLEITKISSTESEADTFNLILSTFDFTQE